MNKSLSILLLLCLSFTNLLADEGMWLLPYLKQQNYSKMKEMGLKLTPEEIYNPNNDQAVLNAVIHFGGGCSGVVVSPEGLLLTNHHCGYDQIQNHSTIEHNYLRDGFYAKGKQEELPNPGLTVTFTEEIIDLTEYVQSYLIAKQELDPMNYMRRAYLHEIATTWYKENRGNISKGTELELAPFYEGNKFFLFIQKVYSDIRLVAAPPSCIGKFGADTDNWVWPRHSGDFSVFRIYTAPDGSPAEYKAENIPLKPKHYLPIALNGVKADDFVMIIGFPGRTNHFYTAPEVAERRDIDNRVRIDMREVRQNALYEQMMADERINIQYASKYQGSTNAYKNAIGSNWAINKLDFESLKRSEMEQLRAYAQKNGKKEFASAIEDIEEMVNKRAELRRLSKLLDEGLWRAVEILRAPLLDEDEYNRLSSSTPQELDKWLSEKYDTYFNKDYNATVDRKVTKQMLSAFKNAKGQTKLLSDIQDVEEYVNTLFDTTIYRERETLKNAILKNRDYNGYLNDPLVKLAMQVRAEITNTLKALEAYDKPFAIARKTYVAGIMEMKGEMNIWPDANSTLRYTFGRVKGYAPKDNVYYGHQTTLDGVMEKEVPNNPEFYLLPRIKEIYQQRDFGALALANGKMPVNFCATTHTTGGNSGSPVINGEGKLVGLNFDRNWEGVGGDISYLPDYQRSIICDARYIVLILEKYLQADRLIQEMEIN